MASAKKVILLGLGLAALGFGVWWFINNQGPRTRQAQGPMGKCEIKIDQYAMKDEFMGAMVPQGSAFEVEYNWYQCNPIERDDVVLYKKGELAEPVVRVVRGVPGDSFKLIKDDRGSWNIEINDKLLMAGEAPYHFGSNNPPLLALNEKASDGVLGPGQVIVFGVESPGYDDSGLLGALSVKDLVAKVDMNTVKAGAAPSPEPVAAPTPAVEAASGAVEESLPAPVEEPTKDQ